MLRSASALTSGSASGRAEEVGQQFEPGSLPIICSGSSQHFHEHYEFVDPEDAKYPGDSAGFIGFHSTMHIFARIETLSQGHETSSIFDQAGP